MKFAPIVPIPMLDEIAKDDYHMVLAPQLASHAYVYFYARHEGFKILDNGAAEGALTTTQNLVRQAFAVGASEVIAPDIMETTGESIRLLRRFTQQWPMLGTMSVLQGKTWEELNKALWHAMEYEVVSLGLPKSLCKYLGPRARLRAAECIRRDYPDIPIHCLGCSGDPQEARVLAQQGIVRGIDSSAPAVLGLQGKTIATARYTQTASHKAVPGFWDCGINDQVRANLDIFRAWCEAAPSR
jgi:hypothetical protein